jgi:hypothetical protein
MSGDNKIMYHKVTDAKIVSKRKVICSHCVLYHYPQSDTLCCMANFTHEMEILGGGGEADDQVTGAVAQWLGRGVDKAEVLGSWVRFLPGPLLRVRCEAKVKRVRCEAKCTS